MTEKPKRLLPGSLQKIFAGPYLLNYLSLNIFHLTLCFKCLSRSGYIDVFYLFKLLRYILNWYTLIYHW